MGPRKMFPKNTEPMDQWLEGQGLYRKHIANDGSCLFRAFCEQVFLTQAVHEDVRHECLEFMEKNTSLFEMFLEEPINIHLERMKTSKDWGGLAELNALALMYKRDVVLFKEVGKPPLAVTNHGFQDKVFLCLLLDNHYDSVYTKSYISMAAFCQLEQFLSPFFTYSPPIGAHVLETYESHQMTATVSALLYNVLYKDVFKLSDVTYAVEKMLHDKSYRPSRRDSCTNHDNCVRFSLTDYPGSDVHGRHNGDERHCQEYEYWYEQDDGNLNVKELLAQGLTPFPYKVAKALDPNLYRNIEFDVWSDIRRDIRQGLFDISNGAFQVGVKCLVNMDPERSFHAHIQEMAPNKGPVVVYVEELAEKCTVSYDILKPLPSNGQVQWQLPYKQHWYQTNRRSTIYTLSDFGKKCRYGRCHKIKEVFDPASVNPRLQYSSKTTHNIKYPSECSPRYTSNERSSQQVSQDTHNFSTIPVPVSLKQPSVTSSHFVQTTSSSGISGTTTLLMPATPPAAPAPSSRPPEPDSSTPFLPPPPPRQSIMAFNESLTISSTTARTMNHPPPQIVTFTLYPDTSSSYHFVPPCMTTNLEDNKHIPKVGSNSISCGVAGLPNVTQSSENGYSPAKVELAPIAKDVNGNIALNHINFTAQKSMNNDGSDLPLSDITTLRFFYNLGVDHFQLGYKMWPGDVPQPITISANCGQPCVSSASDSGSYAEQYPLPDSTTCLGEDGYQPDTVVSLDQVSSNEGMQSHKEASTGWQIEPAASNMVYNVPIHGNRHYVPPRFQKEKLVESSSQQSYLKPQIVHEGNHLPTPSSDSGHGSGSANPTDLSSSGYTIPYQHSVSCTYPSMCNHPMMPCYYPVESDPNLVSMNVPYYQQYVMGPPPQPYIPQSQGVSGGKMASQSSSQYGAPATVYTQPPTESVPESMCCPGYLSMPPQAMTYSPDLGATEGKFCSSESNAVMPQWIPVSSLAAQQGGGLMMQQYACMPPPSQTYSAPN